MEIQNSAPWTIVRLNRAHQQQFDDLSTLCFRDNRQFWSHPSTYLWSEKEDQAFILGCCQEGRLVAYLKLEIFRSPREFESRLVGMRWGHNTPHFPFPLLYFSKSATDPRFQRQGLNSQLRKIALSLAQSAGCSQAVSSVIENSESMSALKRFGAEFFENPKKWNNRLFRSEKHSFLASLKISGRKIDVDLEPEKAKFAAEFEKWFHPWGHQKPVLSQQYTKRNHFVFGFNDVDFSLEKGVRDRFFVRYGDCERITYDFRTECILAAHEIHQRFLGLPIYLCFSGGLDSEVVVEAFRYARVPFRVIIARFSQDLNLHDYSWAVIYCEKNQIPYEFFDFDFLSFLHSEEYGKLIRQIQCRYPMLTVSMKLMEHVAHVKKGLPILGSGECWVSKVNAGWYLVEPEPIQALYRFLMSRKLSGIPGFFQWSPELMHAYILDPSIQDLIHNRRQGPISTTEIKHEIYAHYFQLEKRPKYRGFEKFPELMKQKMDEAKAIFGTPAKHAETEIHQLLERWGRKKSSAKKAG